MRCFHDLTLASRVPWLRNSTVRTPPRLPFFSTQHALAIQDQTRSLPLHAGPNTNNENQQQDTIMIVKKFIAPLLALGSSGLSTSVHAPAEWFILPDGHDHSSLLASAIFSHLLAPSSFVHGDETTDDDQQDVRLWLHCSSPEHVAAAAAKLDSVFLNPSVSTTEAKQQQQHMNINRSASKRRTCPVGLCVPYPATPTASNVLFHRSCENVRSDIESLFVGHRRGVIPTSVWMLSSLSCPFGGGNASNLDYVRVADDAVHFLSELGCERVFLDDTAACVTGRQIENMMKTFAAVSSRGGGYGSSSCGSDGEEEENYGSGQTMMLTVDRLTCALRTSTAGGSSSDRKNNKRSDDGGVSSIALRQQHAHNERVQGCIRRLFALGVTSVCGTSLRHHHPTTTTTATNSSSSCGSSTNRSADVVKCEDWAALAQVHSWLWSLVEGAAAEMRPGETSVTAQCRLEELEAAMLAEYETLTGVREFASQMFWK